MYKVFFNDKVITIFPKNEAPLEIADAQLIEPTCAEEVIGIVNYFLKSEDEEIAIATEDIQKTWDTVKKNFIVIKAAGGIVIKNETFLFIFRRGKWDLPKGKIDKGETPEHAAIREVEEECGISNLRIIKKLPSTWHIYQSPYPESRGEWILKKTIWFEMDYKGEEPLVPETDEDIVEARWIHPDSFNQILANTYPNLKQIIHLYC